MASRPAIRSFPRAMLLAAGLIGLAAGLIPRQAFAQSVAAVQSAEPSAALPQTPSVELDQYPPPSARRNLVIAGLGSTAAWYGAALAASYAWPDTVGANDLRIPVAGPWMALSHSGCGNVSDCSKVIVVLRAIATTLDAIGQAAGLAIAAEGLFMPTQERKRERATPLDDRASGFKLRPTFDAGKNTVGFGVLGVF